MTNLAYDVFKTKYKLEYDSHLDNFTITFKQSNYINSKLTVTAEYMKEHGEELINEIVWYTKKQFHEYIEDFKDFF